MTHQICCNCGHIMKKFPFNKDEYLHFAFEGGYYSRYCHRIVSINGQHCGCTDPEPTTPTPKVDIEFSKENSVRR